MKSATTAVIEETASVATVTSLPVVAAATKVRDHFDTQHVVQTLNLTFKKQIIACFPVVEVASLQRGEQLCPFVFHLVGEACVCVCEWGLGQPGAMNDLSLPGP